MGVQQLEDFQSFTVTYDQYKRPISVVYYSDDGKLFEIGNYSISYTISGDPIYLGEILYNHRFEISTATFRIFKEEKDNLAITNIIYSVQGVGIVETSTSIFNIPWSFEKFTDILTLEAVGGESPYIWTIVNDTDDKFIINGDKLQLDKNFNIFQNTSHSVTVQVEDFNNYIFQKTLNFNLIQGDFINTQSIDFPGDGSNFVSDVAVCDATTNFSLSFWVKLTTGNNVLFTRWDGSSDCHWRIFQDNRKPRIEISGDGGTINTQGLRLDRITNNTWYHIVFTFDSGTLNGYINGTLENDTTFGTPQTQMYSSVTQNLEIGDSPNGNDNPCDGYMDEFVFFDKTLSQSEVTELYNNGVPTDQSGFSDVSSIKHWYRFGDSLTATPGVIDIITTNNELVFSNGLSLLNLSTDVPP